MTRRRLYRENPQKTLNEDGTKKTIQQQFAELNKFVQEILNRDNDENS
jgi:hypothetical protein